MLTRKKVLIFSFVFLLLGVVYFNSVDLISADSGWDSSYDSGSSSSDWGSSSSDWDSSSSSSNWEYSSSSGSVSFNSNFFGGFPIFMAIFMEIFCSIHYFVFAFLPIGKIFGKNDQKKSMKISLTLFFIRVAILVVMDIINPAYCIVDFVFLFVLAFIVVPVLRIFFGGLMLSNKINNVEYGDVSDSILLGYGITDKERFKIQLFDNYVAVQEAWMNFDYHSLRLLLTDELYNMYYSQLEALRGKGQKNIMSDFEFVDAKICSISQSNGIISLQLFLNVKMYDYVVDYYNNVVRGNKNKKINISYQITFQKSLHKKVYDCPNCGAKVIDENNPRCSYCNSVISSESNDFIMSKKQCISQK